MQDQEIELKFGVVGKIEDLKEALTGLGELSDYQEDELKNCYFDTADRFLFKKGAGLRLRSGKSGCEQTLKLRDESLGGLHQRTEYNAKVPDAAEKPDLSLFEEAPFDPAIDIADLTSRLEPLCQINFKRRSVNLRAFGCLYEVSLDEGRIEAPGGGDGYDINELEVELKESSLDSSRQLMSFMAMLNQMRERNLPLTLEPFSKMHKAALVLRGQERNSIKLPALVQTDLHGLILTSLKSFETLLGLYLVRKNPMLLGYIGYSLKILRRSLVELKDACEINDVINDSDAFKRYERFVKKMRKPMKNLSSYFDDLGFEATMHSVQGGEGLSLDETVLHVRQILMETGSYLLPLKIKVLLTLLDEVVRSNVRT